MTRKKIRALSNLRKGKNKIATKILAITRSDKKIIIINYQSEWKLDNNPFRPPTLQQIAVLNV